MQTVEPIVVAALGKVPKGLEKGLEQLEIRGKSRTSNNNNINDAAN